MRWTWKLTRRSLTAPVHHIRGRISDNSGSSVQCGVKGEVRILGVIMLGAICAVVIAFGVWANRRWHAVDSYYEREFQDPPVADLGSYLGGDR